MPVAEHNLLSLLYALKGTIENRLSQTSNGRDEALKKAYVQTEQALRIVKRLGCLSDGIQENGSRFSRSKVSVREAWEIAVRLLGEQQALDHIEVIERIPEDFPLIRCQRDDFKEILFHLAKNAVQAMEEKGKLILRAQISFSQKEESFGLITLSDTGPGIPQEKLALLFHPFFTTKSEGEGNGLGLYLVKSLVAKNGGSVAVSSFLGSGTTFTLHFPLLAAKA